MLSFCVVVANAFAVTPVVNCPLLPTSLLPIPESKEVWAQQWETWGTEGSPPAQSDTCLPSTTQNLAVSTYLNCSIERVDEQSYPRQAALGGGLLPEALQCSEKNRKAKFKFPQSLLEPLLKLLGSWMFDEPGSERGRQSGRHPELEGGFSVVPTGDHGIDFHCQLSFLAFKVSQKHLLRQQVFPSTGGG